MWSVCWSSKKAGGKPRRALRARFNPESASQLLAALGCEPKGTAIKVLGDPFAADDALQESRPQRTGQMRAAHAPVQARAGETTPLDAKRLHINTQFGHR